MNLVDRARNMILSPKTEWEVIAPEVTPTRELYLAYIIPLAAIGPIAHFVGYSLVGVSWGFGHFRVPILWGLTSGIVQYVLSLVGVFVLALIIDGLAPTFGATKSPTQALKVAAYSMTAVYLASIFSIIPLLGILSILGLYSLYLLYLGLPVLMRAPQEKAAAYTAVIVVCGFVLGIIISVLVSAVTGFGSGGMYPGAMGMAGSDQTNRVVAIDAMRAAQVAAITSQMANNTTTTTTAPAATPANPAAAAGAMVAALSGQGAQVDAVDTSILKGLLPDTVAGMPRTSSESSKSGIATMQISTANGTYAEAGKSIKLTVTDMGAAAAMVPWGMVESDKSTDSGYEKMGKVNGRPTHEEFNKNGSNGQYSVIIGNRFMLEADGTQVDMDALKGAVASIDASKLEALTTYGIHKPAGQ